MSVIITELLSTDSFSGSRLRINANFASLKSEVNLIESAFGLSLTSGNLDVSAATGGQIKGKIGAFNSIQLPATGTATITLNGTTGVMTGTSLTLSTFLTATTVNISLGGTITNQGSFTQQGTSSFADLISINGGYKKSYLDIGLITTHTVVNSDTIIIFDGITSPSILTLAADASLVDGHIVTFIKKGTGGCSMDTANIIGYVTGSIDFHADSFKSSITLMYSTTNAGWIVIGQVSMTLV